MRATSIGAWAYLVIGICQIVSGLTAKTLINESEFPATEDERKEAKATPWKRLIVAGAGLAACVQAETMISSRRPILQHHKRQSSPNCCDPENVFACSRPRITGIREFRLRKNRAYLHKN
jgi:hypothetical protein